MNYGIVKDTKIAVADGRNFVGIGELIGTKFPVYCYDGNSIDISWAYDVQEIGREDVWEVRLDDGSIMFANENQEFMLRDGSYCTLGNLNVGDSLMPLNKHVYQGYVRIVMTDGTVEFEHRLFAECKSGRSLLPYPDEVVHHINRDSLDNRWENLEMMSAGEHSSIHNSGENHYLYGKSLSAEHRAKISVAVSGENHPFYGKSHSEESRAKISAAKSGVPLSEAHRAKLRVTNSGKNHSMYGTRRLEETRKKIADSLRGRTSSPEKIEMMKKSWQALSVEEKRSSNVKTWKTKILTQAKWMLDNEYPIDERSWDSYKDEFCQVTGRKRSMPLKTVLKYFQSVEELLEELEDFNHKIMEILYYDDVPIYSMSVEGSNNFAVLTSDLSGIIIRGS